MKKGGIKVLIIAIILAIGVVAYYFYLNNKSKEVKEVKSVSEVDAVLLRNLDKDYPPSPKEVVKLYAQITKCFYDDGFTEEQLSRLAEKSRALLDDELKATQTDDEYLRSLKFDIDGYNDKSLRISSYTLSPSVDVEYWKKDGADMASLYCTYNIRQSAVMTASKHEYILRKDANGHWKILGWVLANDTDEERYK